VAGVAALGGAAVAWRYVVTPAFAQNPPSGCPTPPSGGTPFQPGQDQRPIVLRPSISALTSAQLTELRGAYAALRALPSSDPRTWILQADLHALYCQQCTNDATQIHFKWSFFPWHRAYLYYYERILGALVGNLDGFRLPYWDWEVARSMPSPYRTPAAASNSLWDANRDGGIAGGGGLPSGDGDLARVQQLYGTQDFATFGGNASSAGACENNPHGLIHDDVGEQTPTGLDMGNLGFAARDPIFFAHHGNLDKLWSHWNGLAGTSGVPATAYRNPTDPGFLNATWSFYDETSAIVSMRASDVLDHSDNLRYIYALPVLHIPIYEIIRCELICCGPDPEKSATLRIPQESVDATTLAVRDRLPTSLVLHEVEIPAGATGTFEAFAVRGERRVSLGRFAIVGESHMAMKGAHRMTLLLDATKALPDLLAREAPATLRVIGRRGAKSFPLRAKGAELRIQRSAVEAPRK